MLYYETELPKGALTKRLFSNNLFKATLVKTQSEEFKKKKKKNLSTEYTLYPSTHKCLAFVNTREFISRVLACAPFNPFALTWCRCLGQNRRTRCVFFHLSAEHLSGWCPKRCSCWSKMISFRPMTRPVNTKHHQQRQVTLTMTVLNFWLYFWILTFIWKIHLSSILKPTFSGTAWKICREVQSKILYYTGT